MQDMPHPRVMRYQLSIVLGKCVPQTQLQSGTDVHHHPGTSLSLEQDARDDLHDTCCDSNHPLEASVVSGRLPLS